MSARSGLVVEKHLDPVSFVSGKFCPWDRNVQKCLRFIPISSWWANGQPLLLSTLGGDEAVLYLVLVLDLELMQDLSGLGQGPGHQLQDP